ncbi:MAG TPA: NAD(P)/FAD-dependent oxidoreductase [Tepidisphaeraceae bacterium]|jgi:thioredoxin reductase (NADPH)|nr:NAD(P)/FAD-dependent oxidoreductase [Tepidisphaeraceae bacterium]
MELTPSSVVDLAIIGAGPTGLFASFYAGLRRMSVKLIDSLDMLGGQLTTLYPEKYIYDVAGFPAVLAKDLSAKLVEQALHYGPGVCLGEQVKKLDFDETTRHYTIHTSKGSHGARAILIAAGMGAFSAKTLPLPNAAGYEGRGLHYFVKEVAAFQGKRVLIVGGGDSAVDWANTLGPVAQHVTLIHRRDQFRAHEDSVAQMMKSTVKIRTFHELKSLGGNGQLASATIYDNRSKQEETLELDAVLVNIGFSNSLGPIKDWGLILEGSSIRVDSMMQCNRPGIFAAGDVATYSGKLKLIATGFGEACIAVNFAKHYLDPAASIFPGHSSNSGL